MKSNRKPKPRAQSETRRRKHRSPELSDAALLRQAERDLRAAQKRGVAVTGARK